MKNSSVKIACGAPQVHLADPIRNADELIRLTKEAAAENVDLIVYPELCLTGYTCGDLFLNEKLISTAKKQLKRYLEQTKDCGVVSIVGLPLSIEGRLFNCAAVCLGGEVAGLVPKAHLSAGELRQFASAEISDSTSRWELFDKQIPFGMLQTFALPCDETVRFGIEILSDSDGKASHAAALIKAGASIVCHPTASAEFAGRIAKRRQNLLDFSKRSGAYTVYAACGEGESTTDYVFGAHRLICNGTVLAEAQPFDFGHQILSAEIAPAGSNACPNLGTAELEHASAEQVDPHPFFPADPAALSDHCRSILNIQAHGLKQRIVKAYAKKAVIGISGGLDSTLAILVAARAMDLLNRPRTDILAVTMPCFGTTSRTKSNATILCEELGVDFRCVTIGDAVNLHFKDIGHDPTLRDVTYENSQARERTQVLMDLANECGGMVIGTGDLSELALGWATYNGDHMSMYGVNANLPKTLIRHVVAYCADQAELLGQGKLAASLRDILDTPVSPELLPADGNGQIAQKTEDLVGPYELHDFYIYYLLFNGYSPEKLYRLAKKAFGEVYSDQVLLKWLEVFLRRFFNQQFKRSCLPDGPAVFPISLSPRGGWAMPSDASSAIWLEEIRELKETIS